jgi:hypothetical protein
MASSPTQKSNGKNFSGLLSTYTQTVMSALTPGTYLAIKGPKFTVLHDTLSYPLAQQALALHQTLLSQPLLSMGGYSHTPSISQSSPFTYNGLSFCFTYSDSDLHSLLDLSSNTSTEISLITIP